MYKDAYSVLGINSDATFVEIDEAYRVLSMKYKTDRFLEGEEGTLATKKLEELELAYAECRELAKSRASYDNPTYKYDAISSLVKSGSLEEAQKKLDNIEYRDADWHYYQSIIYYKKNWLDDSKKQLEISVNLDPTNQKYTNALSRLNEDMAKTNPFNQPNANMNQSNQNNQNNQNRAGYAQPTQQQQNSKACCDTCCCMMCMDNCCECCGGDLISCC